jgi:hypothetical protein
MLGTQGLKDYMNKYGIGFDYKFDDDYELVDYPK